MHSVVFGAIGLLALAGPVMAEDDVGTGMHRGMAGNGDHKITKAEFMKRAEERFARLDVNKDGVIDATDRKQLRQRMHECRQLMGDMGMMGGRGSMMGGYGSMMDGHGAMMDGASTPPAPKPTTKP
jgi:hypothetical protein